MCWERLRLWERQHQLDVRTCSQRPVSGWLRMDKLVLVPPERWNPALHIPTLDRKHPQETAMKHLPEHLRYTTGHCRFGGLLLAISVMRAWRRYCWATGRPHGRRPAAAFSEGDAGGRQQRSEEGYAGTADLCGSPAGHTAAAASHWQPMAAISRRPSGRSCQRYRQTRPLPIPSWPSASATQQQCAVAVPALPTRWLWWCPVIGYCAVMGGFPGILHRGLSARSS